MAEYHENLQHVLVFLTVSGLKAGHNLDAEVLPSQDTQPSCLVLKCHAASSLPLKLPTQVSSGPAVVSVVGGQHYQIKLASNSPMRALDSPASLWATITEPPRRESLPKHQANDVHLLVVFAAINTGFSAR